MVKDYPPPHPKKKKKKFWIITCTTIWLCYSHYGVFCSFILLIYSSQKVPRSLKFCTALHILVLHMHRKFDVDSIDSFWDMEEQSMRRKERKKELECYCCKQQLKDSNLTFTLTLKVNKCWSAHGFKNKSLRTDKVNQTAQSTVKSSNFHAFRSSCPHVLFIAHQCRKKKWSPS